MGKEQEISIFWFRRDLRLNDNAGLYRALKVGKPVLPIFIFDKCILDKLQDKSDPRVSFIHKTLTEINTLLKEYNSSLVVKYGEPMEVWKELLAEYKIDSVFTNRDYEVYAKDRDKEVSELLQSKGIEFKDYKDHVIFDRAEVLKKDGTPYTVFTPYSKVWKAKLVSDPGDKAKDSYFFKAYPTLKYASNFVNHKHNALLTLKSMGFVASDLEIPKPTVTQGLIKAYADKRNLPAVNGRLEKLLRLAMFFLAN
jgi:deoxyribodipyrimidine photo-lyase